MTKFPITNFWNEMNRLQDEMVRFFEPYRSGNEYSTAHLNVYQDENSITVITAVPGLEAEDIDINLEGKTLEISGEWQEKAEVSYQKRERRRGKFYRKIQLPNEVDSENSQADLKEGILTLKFPVREESKPKKILIKGDN